MTCEVCGKNAASVHVIEIVDGQKRSLHLCPGCAEEKGSVIDPSVIQVAASQMKKLLAPVLAPGGAVEAPSAANPRCPECGLTWKEFRKNNRFGCANDYTAFGELIENLLQKIHGGTVHRGRISERAAAKVSRVRRLEGLRSELETAVRSEDYEKAAELRDKIRCIEREGDQDHATG